MNATARAADTDTSQNAPQVFVIGGPNGAGKSTMAETIIGQHLALGQFVNADTIARGLAGFNPDSAAVQAGRVMLARLRELAAERVDFSFETTLASRTFANWFNELRDSGYQLHLIYTWLRSPRLAVARVKRRVQRGGHSVPEDVIIRRYHRSVSNLFDLYLPLADGWRVYDNSGKLPRIVAEARSPHPERVYLPDTWRRMKEAARA